MTNQSTAGVELLEREKFPDGITLKNKKEFIFATYMYRLLLLGAVGCSTVMLL